MTTTQAIREKITSLSVGEPFTPALFAGMGSRASIDQALMRMVQEGRIERIGRGLFIEPQNSRFGLKVMPAPEAIAQTIAANDGAKIEVHGAEAARRFGLSTQVPVHLSFYTSGPSHTVKMGKLKIRLQHVAARKLALAGRPAGQALTALWYLGRQNVTPTTFQSIASKLPVEEFEALSGVKSLMPAWMVEALIAYEQGFAANG
jgi:hypothetical protein